MWIHVGRSRCLLNQDKLIYGDNNIDNLNNLTYIGYIETWNLPVTLQVSELSQAICNRGLRELRSCHVCSNSNPKFEGRQFRGIYADAREPDHSLASKTEGLSGRSYASRPAWDRSRRDQLLGSPRERGCICARSLSG